MVETTKQVRVDNWGIYFLQRLQLFFSKTDYCDLTLQFEGNVQLKVHRLVMNACTEYFAFLEQTCPALEENTILMPTDLQADVIVPIVNFMYTGMLEFHPSIFEKLYKAADTMNIAVLTKLLEAQMTKIKTPKKDPPQPWSRAKRIPKPQPVANELPSPLPGKKLPVWRKRQAASTAHPVSTTFSASKWNSEPQEKDPLAIVDNTPKPTRFEWPDEDQPPFNLDPSFDDVSLTSKPLWTKEDDQKAGLTFEEARSEAQKSRHADSQSNSLSQDVDEDFLPKEQKVNISQLEDSLAKENSLKRKPENKVASSPKRVKITNQDDETIISISTNNPSELDHTKIVSEILKKYPDLVKKKKNIKLKITSTKNEQPQVKVQTVREKVKPQVESPVEKPSRKEIKTEPSPTRKEIKTEPATHKEPAYNNTHAKRRAQKAEFRVASEEGPWTCMECLGDGEAPEFVLYYLFRKHMTDMHHMEFDSSFCKYCGKKCPTERCNAYHLYTKHGLRPPADIKFPQCTSCPFIGLSNEKLNEHMRNHGPDEEQCANCKLGFLTSKDLINHHQITGHANRNASSLLDCAYCMKKHQSPVTLFTHIRTQHMKEARRDNITCLDEVMDVQYDVEYETEQHQKGDEMPRTQERNREVIPKIDEKHEAQMLKERVNIISNVKVSKHQKEEAETVVNSVEQPTVPEAEPVSIATTTAAALGNIGGNLATNLGLVDIVVLDDNQQYILQQPQGQAGNTEFILPELTGNEGILQAATAAADLNSTDELVMVLTDHDYQDEQNQGQSDNSNIVVLYSHPVEGQQGQFITSQGNLLVNSQGILEIRNGAGITTTAGQILVNSDNTTTTQAIESPVESIEMIRKEIEGELGEQVAGKEIVKAVLRKKVLDKEMNNSEKEVTNDKGNNQSIQSNIDNNVEDGAGENSGELIDATDSSIQEEPMEVDEIGPQQSENLEEGGGDGEEENQPENNSLENQEIVAKENEQINEEPPGEDIPPDSTTRTEENQEANKESEVKLPPISEEGSSEFNETLGQEKEVIHETAEDKPEPMEVDGEKVSESNEQLEGEDQVDNIENQLGSSQDQTQEEQALDEPEKDRDELDQKSLQHPNESIEDDPNHGIEDTQEPVMESEQQQRTKNEEPSSTQNNQPPCLENEDDIEKSNVNNDEERNRESDQVPSVENDQIPRVENDQVPNVENDQVPSVENDQVPSVKNDQVPSVENNQVPSVENDQVPSVENDQVPSVENDQGARMESGQEIGSEQNDQNDNVQPNFEDFTDESQQSSTQKIHRDLNKEILDDWDDTDSQQSQSQEQDSHEEVQDQAAINAAENVNKLMDDWDEEDEEQSKE